MNELFDTYPKKLGGALGSIVMVGLIILAVLSARADGRVDYCYLESSMYDAETVFAIRRIHLKGHRKWSIDITLWSERVAMADSIHGMELVGMAASQFCPDGKVH